MVCKKWTLEQGLCQAKEVYRLSPKIPLLRIQAMYGASKTPLFYILFDIFINAQAIKNLNDTFFDKMSIDEKS